MEFMYNPCGNVCAWGTHSFPSLWNELCCVWWLPIPPLWEWRTLLLSKPCPPTPYVLCRSASIAASAALCRCRLSKRFWKKRTLHTHFLTILKGVSYAIGFMLQVIYDCIVENFLAIFNYLMQTTPTMRIHKLITDAVIVIITTATSENKINMMWLIRKGYC